MTEIYERFRDLLDHGSPTTATLDEPADLVGARYGEWVDGAGGRQAGFLPQREFLLSQRDMATVVVGSVDADDVAIVAVPYELTFIGHVVERALELIGATVIGVGTSNTICPMPRALGLMRRYGASVMVSSAERAMELARLDQSLNEHGDRHSLQTLVIVGQVCSPKRLGRISELWGANPIPLFGNAAVPLIATPGRCGELHLTGDWLAACLQAPAEAKFVSGGLRGELLLTPARPLAKGGEATATGELVELWPEGQTCACGDVNPVIVPVGRVVDTVVGRNGPVSAVDVERLLFDQMALNPDFECTIVDRRFHVRCTTTPEVSLTRAELERSMHNHLLSELGVDVAITISGPSTTEGEDE